MWSPAAGRSGRGTPSASQSESRSSRRAFATRVQSASRCGPAPACVPLKVGTSPSRNSRSPKIAPVMHTRVEWEPREPGIDLSWASGRRIVEVVLRSRFYFFGGGPKLPLLVKLTLMMRIEGLDHGRFGSVRPVAPSSCGGGGILVSTLPSLWLRGEETRNLHQRSRRDQRSLGTVPLGCRDAATIPGRRDRVSAPAGIRPAAGGPAGVTLDRRAGYTPRRRERKRNAYSGPSRSPIPVPSRSLFGSDRNRAVRPM